MKKYKRLITFGDSYTYGHSLPDCIRGEVSPGHLPSRLGYVNKLASLLGIEEVHNFSMPGGSNKLIYYKAVNFNDYTEDDLVLIQFSFKERTFYIDHNANSAIIGAWRLNPEDEYVDKNWEYFLNRSEYEMLYDSYTSIFSTLNYFENKPCELHCMSCNDIQRTYGHFVNKNNTPLSEGLHVSNLNADSFFKNTLEYVKSKMTLQQEFSDFWKYSADKNDLALDNSHPGLESHTFFANTIFKKIKNEKILI